jgi:predicted enzyme related to lactoylglutathione lyase
MRPKVSISIDVSDMKKASSFYSDALGCKKDRDGDEVTVLSADNTTIYLLKKDPGSNPLLAGNAARDFDRHWTPVHLDFVVSNIDETLALVLKYGGSHEGGESGDWGSIAYCADPFGNGFCLVVMNE